MSHDRYDRLPAELIRGGFRPKRELGQNFLLNRFALEQIVDCAGIEPGDLVIEAGAGTGSLTDVLVERGARIVAIELDSRLIPYLSSKYRGIENVRIIHGDVQKQDIDTLASCFCTDTQPTKLSPLPYKICANLPYGISTAFITRAFRELRALCMGAFLVQKEVAQKLIALPGQEGFGMLTLAANRFGEVRSELSLGPEYFTPPPPIDSTVISFRRRVFDPSVDEQTLWRIIRSSYNHRRKSLLNGLKAAGLSGPGPKIDWGQILAKADIDGRRRPETLSLDEYMTITRCLM